ncbi:hypothetical protein WR25_08425 isoform A [Diploscapter pachys]|nr:hypothetical protein WR25_08425 isoform A [Diploscapter pachys]
MNATGQGLYSSNGSGSTNGRETVANICSPGTATPSHLSGVLANVTLCNGNGTSNGHPQMPSNQSQIHCAMPPSDNDLARLIDHGCLPPTPRTPHCTPTTLSTPSEHQMSINEHLSSIPSWIDGHIQQQRQQSNLQHPVGMLSLGGGNGGQGQGQTNGGSSGTGAGNAGRQTANGNGAGNPRSIISQHGNSLLMNSCDGRMGSSSDNSATCSPSSSDQQQILGNHQTQQSGAHLKMADSLLDASVAAIINQAMKPEPPLDSGYLTAMSRQQQGLQGHPQAHHNHAQQHRHNSANGQPMPVHMAYGRCSDPGTLNTPSSSAGNGGPAPVSASRRTRSAHEGMHKCSFCPKKWDTEEALQHHMSDCRMIRSHECAQCGKRFKARGGLQQHLRIHSNDRPYQCHFCQKRFTQKSHVDQHERIHTGAKPFTCQYCGRAFRQRSQQMGHEATHTSHLSQVAASLVNRNEASAVAAANSREQERQEQQQQQEQAIQRQAQQLSAGDFQMPPELSSHMPLSLLALSHSSSAANPVSSLLALSQQQTMANVGGVTSTTFMNPMMAHSTASVDGFSQQGLINGLHG